VERTRDVLFAVGAFCVASALAVGWGRLSIETVWVSFVLFPVLIGGATAFIAARRGRTGSEVAGWFAAGLIVNVFALVGVLFIRPRTTRADLRP
jgi:hypothetical protein